MEPEPVAQGVRIPADQLAPDTLRSLVEEFVTRDGTELTEASTKIEQVEGLLRRGAVEIWFDELTRTCSIVAVEH